MAAEAKVKNLHDREDKLQKNNKQLDFFALMVEQGLERQNEVNNALFKE